MIPFFRKTQQLEAISSRRPNGKRESCRRSVRLHLEELEARIVPTTYTLPLQNLTGLNPAQESVYVLGYSAASQLELQSNGQFGAFPSTASGTIPSYNISTMPNIYINSAQALIGARLYFIVAPPGTDPTFAYSNNGSSIVQPTNPPNAPYPYGIVEITQPLGGLPTIDVQTVDGFIFPLTLTLNSNLGQVGQPVPSTTVNRASILSAYTTFMDGQGAAGVPYQSLMFGPNSIAGQAGGIVNPGAYLAAGANPSSALNTVWNTDLTTLFETPSRTISMIGDDGAYYKGTPTQVNGNWVLHFVGYTNASETTTNGNVFNIYNPLTRDPLGSYQTNETAGEMVFANDGVFADTSANVMLGTPTSQSYVALGLERDIVAALNRGVALLGPIDGLNGDNSTYWGTETKWYPAGQTENLFSMFMHTGTVNGTPIFTLPSGAVADAQGTLMGQAYGFAYDENPGHGPGGQPNVPSKFDPVPAATTTATITLGPWFQPVPTSLPSSPSPRPTGITPLFFLAEDEFALTVDSLFSQVTSNPVFTQAADHWIELLNDRLGLDNPALGTGLTGLQSAIDANVYYGTIWGLVGEAAGLEWAAESLNLAPTTLSSRLLIG